MVALLQSRVDVLDDRELGAGLAAGGAESVADGTDIGGTQLEALACVDLDRIHEPATDELGAGNERDGSADVLLQQMQPVDRRLVIRAVEIVGECTRRVKQPHAEAFAAAVRLQNKRAPAEALAGRFDEQLLAGNDDGIRRADAGGFEGGVLARFADLEVERAAAVDDAAPVALEPGEH